MWKKLAFLAILIMARPLMAQVSISGIVLDQMERGIPQAKMKIEPPNPALAQEVVSNEKGAFIFSFDLPGGEYFLSARAANFQEMKREPVFLIVGENKIIVTLTPIDTYSLEVSAQSQEEKNKVSVQHMPLSETLENEEIKNVAASRFDKLVNIIATFPGITKDERGRLHPFGSQSDQTNWLLDGFRIYEPANNQFEMKLSADAPDSIDLFASRYSVADGRGSAIMKINSGMGNNKFWHNTTNFFPGIEHKKGKGLILSNWNPRLSISGPVIKQKAWFFNSLDANYNKDVIHELLSGQDEIILQDASNLLRLQANFTPVNILTVSALAHYFNSPRSDLSVINPRETTSDRRSRRYFFSIRDQIITGKSDIVSLGYARYWSFAREIPQGHEILRLFPLTRKGNAPLDATRLAWRDQLQVDVALRKFEKTPNHRARLGFDLNCSKIRQNNSRTGYQHHKLDGTPTTLVTFGGKSRFELSNCENAVYLQDRYSLTRQSTGMRNPWLINIEGGLRFDREGLIPRYVLTPRVGLTFIPAWSTTTKFSIGFGLMPAMTNLALFGRSLDQYSLNQEFDKNGRLNSPLLTIFLADRRQMKIPTISNLSAGMEKDLPANFYFRINYLRTRGRDSYAFAPSWDKSLIPNIDKFPTDQIAVIFNLNNSGTITYDSIGLALVKKFRKPPNPKLRQDDLTFSYVRSRSFSNSNWFPYIEEPTIFSDSAGRTPWDMPNRFTARGITQVGVNNSISYFAEWHDGTPFSVHDDEGRQYGEFNSWRLPRFFSLNTNFERKINLWGQRWGLLIGIRNATNRPNYTQANQNFSAPGFPNYYGIDPRKIVFRIRWLGKKNESK